jgi:hypothetical protein
LAVEPLETRTVPDATLLIGTWNVGIADAGYRLGSYDRVLAAIGNESRYASPRPLDILAVTETRSNAPSGATADTEFLTQILNGLYGPGAYDHGTRNGFSTGGGTEGVIFNTQTVQLLEETAVGFASSTGPARQELRYRFRPVGYDDGSADFYVYVGHYKAGNTATNLSRKEVEAEQVRADADVLGAGTHILYTGDFNAYNSNEPGMQTLMADGPGQAFDPINRLGQWFNNAAMLDIMTESPAVNAPAGLIGGGLKNRFDLLWESGAVVGDYGLQALPATYHTFGVDGSVALRQAVDDPSNTALPELADRLAVLDALANDTSDHLPVLQEYQVVTPPGPGPGTKGEPGALSPGASPPPAAPVLPPSSTAWSTVARSIAPDSVAVGETYHAERQTAGWHLAEGDGVIPGVQAQGPDPGTAPRRAPAGKAVEMTARDLGRVVGRRLVVPGGAAGLWEHLPDMETIQVTDAADG